MAMFVNRKVYRTKKSNMEVCGNMHFGNENGHTMQYPTEKPTFVATILLQYDSASWSAKDARSADVRLQNWVANGINPGKMITLEHDCVLGRVVLRYTKRQGMCPFHPS